MRWWPVAVQRGVDPTGGRDDGRARAVDHLRPCGHMRVERRCRAARAGLHHLRVDGNDRAYLLTLPPVAAPAARMPLVLDFHGHGGSIAKQEANTRLGASGTRQGFAVVTPQALGSPSRWNFSRNPGSADDFTFVHALLADLRRHLCIDPRRVYAVGHSNGAAFAGFVVCDPPYEFAAAVMVSATVPAICPVRRATPSVLTIRGTADPTVPYVPAALDAAMASYIERYGCDRVPARDAPGTGVLRVRYANCRSGAEVVADTIAGGLHAWPGGPAAQQAGNSDAGRDFDATGEVLTFLARHRRSWPR